MTRKEWKIQAARRLASTDAPALTAQLLLCHVLDIDRVALIAHSEEAVPADAEKRLEALLQRRERGEPLAYILGSREFYGRDFEVNPHTLIPRPETEHLIETALEFFDGRGMAGQALRFIDLGTGSGCIAVTLAAERPAWQGTALDISPGALETARRNAVANGVELKFLQADFTRPLPFEPAGFDLVVSNLTALQRDGVPFTVRIPLIPDFNTDKDSVAAIGELLRSRDIRYAELLPFHRLGSAKYEAMGLEYPYKDYVPPTADESAAMAALFEPYVNVKLER